MKKSKRLFAVLLVFVMIFVCAVPVYAENDNSTKVNQTNVNEKSVLLTFSDMIFDKNKDNNVTWFEVLIPGEYKNVEKFIIHFTMDKDILKEDGIFAGDVTLDYKTSWEDTDIGYDYIISSWYSADFNNFLYHTGFKILTTGIHKLSATAEVIYKNGDSENLKVDCKNLNTEVIDILAENTDIVNVRIPEVMYTSRMNAEDICGPDFTVSVSTKDSAKYSQCKFIISYNPEVIDLRLDFMAVPAIATPIIDSFDDADGCLTITFEWDDEEFERTENYRNGYNLPFVVLAIGEPQIEVSAEAYDLNGNEVEITINYINNTYEKTVDIAELELINFGEEIEKEYYGAVFNGEIFAKDILSKIDAESAVIKNPDGEILADNDMVPTKSRIVTLYKGYEVNSIPLCIKYDVDCDGKVTAADARLTLRRAAEMENLEMWQSADIDGNRKITAADARSILRKAANLD